MRFLLAGVLLLCTGSAMAVTVVDALGHPVQLAQPARRIISLAPSVTELLFAAGAGASVVGADVWSDYPPPARQIPRIGDAARIDLERVLTLHPDLVVAWDSGNPRADVEHLRRLGLPVYVTEPRRLSDITDDLRKLGRLAGTGIQAETVARAFETQLVALRTHYAGRRPVRVFYQISAQPLMTVNGAHLISAVLELCGGRNVFAGLAPLAPAVSEEAVLAADPEAIIAGTWPGEPVSVSDSWRNLPAARNGRVFALSADTLHRGTPRILEGAWAVCRNLDEVRR